MKKLFIIISILLLYRVSASAQIFGPNHHIICYFTRPVDTTVARGEKAISLVRTAGDTVIAYIDRAKYTLDIAMYDFVEDSTWFEHGNIPDIAAAVNRAYARGVKIRWICNQIDSAYSPNTGLDSINKAIPVLPSPSGGNYSIMHNKVMIIDGRSSNPGDPIVWTGCMNWEPGQIDKDANNLVIIQDSALAHCYLTEFNQMWGDTVEGGMYNLANSKFGPYKKDITPHHFIIDGHKVDSYFSPSDSVNDHIIATLAAAKKEIDFGVFEFSVAADANEIVSMINKGIYVTGVMDQYSLQYSPFNTLSAKMGPRLQLYAGTDSLFHNKFVIIDPCDMKADPMVLTGSHNWTTTATTSNDENTLIIHDSTVANLFYQAYHRTFEDFCAPGAPIISEQCVPLGIDELNPEENISVYPDPANKQVSLKVDFPGKESTYEIFNIMGQKVLSGKLQPVSVITLDINAIPAGIYMIVVQNGNTRVTKKFAKQ